MKVLAFLFFAGGVSTIQAQGTVSLPAVTVTSPRVANQSPSGTFAMPVSALRYEPGVDLQARNLAEGQADVTIRGGIFESAGFHVGAVTLLDPQTGHYLAEIPISPAMLGAPEVTTGAELAARTTNATSGAVSYPWREIRTAGATSVGLGEYGLRRGDIYQGFTNAPKAGGGQRVGADFGWAASQSDGSIPFGEHRFERINGRLQFAGGSAQTDFFAGYQTKFFGWPNLYTPFNSNETENLQTVLLATNHRIDFGVGEFIEAGAYHRRNKDDYAFNRFAPLGPIHPFQHTTWISGAAVGGRRGVGPLILNFRGEVLADDLKSTSLTAGRYHSRTLTKVALVPEKTWTSADGSHSTLKAGATYDDSNRDGGAGSPVFEIAHQFPSVSAARIYLSYAKTTQLPSYTALNSSASAGLFRGNPNLGRETSRNLESGISATALGWSGKMAFFFRREDSLVDWTFRRGVTARTANPVDVDTLGFESVARKSCGPCEVVLGYGMLSKDANYRGAPVDASFYALNYARHRVTAAFTLHLRHGVELRIDNVARIQADNSLRVAGGNNAVLTSLGVAYRPEAWHGVELSAQVENLWNSGFQEVPAVPAARRQVSFSASHVW